MNKTELLKAIRVLSGQSSHKRGATYAHEQAVRQYNSLLECAKLLYPNRGDIQSLTDYKDPSHQDVFVYEDAVQRLKLALESLSEDEKAPVLAGSRDDSSSNPRNSSPADNAAKRLVEILQRAKSTEISNAPTVVGWARVFGIVTESTNEISEQEEFEVGRRLIQVYGLIDEIETQLLSINGLNHSLYLRSFPRIRSVCRLSTFKEGSLINVMGQLSDADLTVLEFCGHELSKYYSERVVDPDQLKDLTVRIDSLFDEIEGSNLPKELEQFLLTQLETIRRSIQEYRIRGLERLKEALERVVGSMILNEELIKGSVDKAEVGKFRAVCSSLYSIVIFAAKIKPLIQPVAQAIGLLLPGDTNAVPPVKLPPSG